MRGRRSCRRLYSGMVIVIIRPSEIVVAFLRVIVTTTWYRVRFQATPQHFEIGVVIDSELLT